MKFETLTFTLNEKEKENSWSSSYVDIHYCSYCGQKAVRDDIGSSHNHRWEEEIIYYCKCETAEKEKELKQKISNARFQIRQVEWEIKSMKKLEDNDIVNKMKYEQESNKLDQEKLKLKEKYKVT